jgi:hypothetical protein
MIIGLIWHVTTLLKSIIAKDVPYEKRTKTSFSQGGTKIAFSGGKSRSLLMLVAIPLDALNRVYHLNPCSATMFALYEVEGNRQNIHYHFLETRLNPWKKYGDAFHPERSTCTCTSASRNDPHHISDHYLILEAIGKVDCILVDQYCLNTLHVFKNVGIKIHKLPPFIKNSEAALDHFIIGANIADHLQHIHPAS